MNIESYLTKTETFFQNVEKGLSDFKVTNEKLLEDDIVSQLEKEVLPKLAIAKIALIGIAALASIAAGALLVGSIARGSIISTIVAAPISVGLALVAKDSYSLFTCADKVINTLNRGIDKAKNKSAYFGKLSSGETFVWKDDFSMIKKRVRELTVYSVLKFVPELGFIPQLKFFTGNKATMKV